jgi:hypothetical protein
MSNKEIARSPVPQPKVGRASSQQHFRMRGIRSRAELDDSFRPHEDG